MKLFLTFIFGLMFWPSKAKETREFFLHMLYDDSYEETGLNKENINSTAYNLADNTQSFFEQNSLDPELRITMTGINHIPGKFALGYKMPKGYKYLR